MCKWSEGSPWVFCVSDRHWGAVAQGKEVKKVPQPAECHHNWNQTIGTKLQKCAYIDKNMIVLIGTKLQKWNYWNQTYSWRAWMSLSKALWATPDFLVWVMAPPSSWSVTTSLVTSWMQGSHHHSVLCGTDCDTYLHNFRSSDKHIGGVLDNEK